MDLHRLDPRDLDLDTADALAGAWNAARTGTGLPDVPGPSLLKRLQLQGDERPVDGLWVARVGGQVAGYAAVVLPWRDNRTAAYLHGAVHPRHQGRGAGRALTEAALAEARGAGRTVAYTGAFAGTAGEPALARLGWSALPARDEIRRVAVHGTPPRRWQELYDEAAAAAGDYELVRQVGPTPPDRLPALVALHGAINDAPLDDPDKELDVWDDARVAAYDRAMAARRQTVHRVLARHRGTGAWAGMSILCVDEFAPAVAFQEDTSVVRAHRGHRLGLLMKADMLRWVVEERPEVAATDTWNAAANHHMIAVNERLGATVVVEHLNFRREV